MTTVHIKKGDTVQVISGKCRFDKDNKPVRGKVLEVSPSEGMAIVEGVNIVSKHLKPRGQQQQGGIIKTEGPLRVCKLMLVCPKCGKATRVGKAVVDDKKVRVCKKCNANF